MPGSFCISIDLEGAWGIWDKPDRDHFERCAHREHRIVRGLLELFDRYEIPVTWAVVARLMELDDSKPSTSKYGEKIWFGPELIELIRNAGTKHDIGSHSYAHPYYGELSRDEARADLLAAKKVHDRLGLPFDSFVYPRNQIAHLDLLREVGVKVYRSLDVGWHVTARKLGPKVGRIAHLTSQALPLAPAVVSPTTHDGLVELPSSMLFIGRNGARRAILPALTIAKAVRGAKAASSDGCFHLWFHPSNFYHRTDQQLETLGAILATVAAMRDRAELEIKTMRSFAA